VSSSAAPYRVIEVVVVTGLSGSGKSTAIDALEDMGFYCIDNLPIELVPRVVELSADSRQRARRVAFGIDMRDEAYVERWEAVRSEILEHGHRLSVVFLDSADEVLIRRFSETRRIHPLGAERSLPEAIAAERAALRTVQDTADLNIDTSSLNVHDLKRRIRDAFESGVGPERGLVLTVESFGFKYGAAVEADLVLDVRFLPNPHYIPELKPLTGRDEPVASFVLDRDVSRAFLGRLVELLEFLIPFYIEEGKTYLTVALGCTGGQHRSVAIAEEFARRLGPQRPVRVRHRDIERRNG
jgi:UPF0042 nucleotide-binding protein